MFSLLAVCYLFCGGTGAGALVILSCLEILRVLDAGRAAVFVPSDIMARAWCACLFLLGMGVACLAADLGRLGDAWRIFLMPHATALTVGAYALVVACAAAAFFMVARWSDAIFSGRGVVFAFALVGALAGFVVASYTGILLQSMPSVAAWQTCLLPVLFVLSSLSCGAVIVLGAASFSESRFPPLRFFKGLLRFDSALIATELFVLAFFVASMLFDDRSAGGGWALIAGSLSAYFWLGLVVVGLAVPFVLERFVTYASYRLQFVWIACCVLVGGFTVRWCVVELAQFDPSQIYAALPQMASML